MGADFNLTREMAESQALQPFTSGADQMVPSSRYSGINGLPWATHCADPSTQICCRDQAEVEKTSHDMQDSGGSKEQVLQAQLSAMAPQRDI